MTSVIKKVNMISKIVRLRQLVNRWKNKSFRSTSNSSDSDEPETGSNRTPSGSVAILVGPTRIRFVIPTRFLNLPVLVDLLNQTEEEIGYQVNGPLVVHCDPGFFGEIMQFLEEDEERFRGLGLDGFIRLVSEMGLDLFKCTESCDGSAFTPLLNKTKA